jgi:hypothetical protein
MASSPESERPPYYIFVANSSFLATQTPSPSSLLSHPNIQYHYHDDSPLALLPQSPDEHVLVLDYDPSNISHPTVKSISNGLAVTGTKVTDAPGAGVVHADDAPSKNDKMYIIHASSIPDTKYVLSPPHTYTHTYTNHVHCHLCQTSTR